MHDKTPPPVSQSRRRIVTGVGSLCLMAGLPAARAQDRLHVVYPAAQSPIDDYYIALLRLCLLKSGRPHTVAEWGGRAVKARVMQELAQGAHVNVAWALTTPARESALLPVRRALDKGLSGWRIALVRTGDRDRFMNLRSLHELSSYTAGQGYDWADAGIFRANGLPVVTGSDFYSLTKMLDQRRFDYLPRSVSQIWAEAAQLRQDIVIEPHVLLFYPSAVYFFVRQGNEQLASALEAGLQAAARDGSFKRLFDTQYFNRVLSQVRPRSRHVLALRNPDFHPAASTYEGVWAPVSRQLFAPSEPPASDRDRHGTGPAPAS